VDKEYVALVHGITPEEGEIDEPIGRHPKRRTVFTVLEGGRSSQTAYERERTYQMGEKSFSLLRVRPATGRTHQIRVHLKHIRHPVVSDPLYLSPHTLKEDLEFCPRLFLHATALSFRHPDSGARMRFEAELAEDLRAALGKLKPA